MKKEFIEGFYPEQDFRKQRFEEVKKELDVLIQNREYLNKTINQLLFELQILNELDQLENAIDGKINIEMKQNEGKN